MEMAVELAGSACFVDWFGTSYETQVAVSDGDDLLLRTILLDGHRLDIDYVARTVKIS